MAEIHLIATIHPTPGKEEQVREILCRTAEHVSHVEKGCLTWILTEIPRKNGEIEFKVIERWASTDDLTQHESRDWLRQMYTEFEDQHLLSVEEDVQHLKFVAGFASR